MIVLLYGTTAGTRAWLAGGRRKVANRVLDVWLCESSVRRLMTAMLWSSNGWRVNLAVKAVQNSGRQRGFARPSPRFVIARGIVGSTESAIPDRLRGGYLSLSRQALGTQDPETRSGGTPGLVARQVCCVPLSVERSRRNGVALCAPDPARRSLCFAPKPALKSPVSPAFP